jgi:hypothetical protein
MVLTRRNVLPDVLTGRVLGAARLAAATGPAERERHFIYPDAPTANRMTLHKAGLIVRCPAGAAARSGELPAHTDAHALATFYAAVLQGMSAQARDGAARTDLEQIAEAALQAGPPAADHEAGDSAGAAPK